MAVNIVLVEPEIPQNTGNIARTCAATGARLHLVRPLGFEIDDRKLKRAGLDYWDKLDITFYDGIDEFFSENADAKMYFFSTKGKKLYTEAELSGDVYLVFGKETAGLDEALLLKHYENTVRIPMRDKLRSLNLSNSVAIAVYEAFRQRDFAGLLQSGKLTKYDI